MRRRDFLLAAAVPALAQTHAVINRVADRFVPAALDTQRIDGLLGERMRVNLEGRLLHVDEKGLIDCFQHRPGPQAWAGEHAGKFLDAASNTWLYTHDERLRTLMDRIARNLIAAQLPDGYLGTYIEAKRWTSWDTWVHKYDLLGLLSYYRATGYAPALDACRKIGDLLERTFGDGPGQRDIIAGDPHAGMASTSVLEPMALLYRQTGEARYLDFCAYLIRSWDQPNGPKVASSILSTKSVFKTADSKAYEMMSNLVGLLEVYRLTGKPEYLKAAEIAWDDIVAHRLYLDGTTSAKEYFHADLELPGEESSNVGEGCATVTFLQLTWQLLRITGEVKYADQLENTVYNALLAAQDPRKGDICYFTPLNGKKSPTPGINCCVSSEPRGISMIPMLAWGTLGEGVAVNFYVPGRVKLRDVSIESRTSYPLDGTVELNVSLSKPTRFPLHLRVPSWTDSFQAQVGGRTYRGDPGTYLAIDRVWASGDTVAIRIGLATRVISGGPSYPYSVAIARGPQILALESTLNPELIDMQAAGPTAANVELADARVNLPADWAGTQAYRIDGVVAGKTRPLVLVPFADAITYRVWLLQPAQSIRVVAK